MISEVSSIQIVTLIGAVLAAVFSLGSAIYTARFSRRSEHNVWQRDLRVRLYSECAALADKLISTLTYYSANVRRRYTSQASIEREVTHVENVTQLRVEMVSKINEVQTYGAKEVAESAVALGRIILDASDTIVVDQPLDVETVSVKLDKAKRGVADFRGSVRRSLKVSKV